MVKLLYFFTFCILAFLLAFGFIFYSLFQIYIPLNSGQSQIIEINKGQGVKEIAKVLEEKKLIRSDFWFETYLWLEDKQNKLQAGRYLIDSNLSIAKIAEIIIEGRVIPDEVWVTVPEGFTLKQLIARFIENGFDSIKEIEGKTTDDFRSRYQFLADAPNKVSLQGFLFPDTYKFKKEAGVDELIAKMLDNFDGKLTAKMRQDIKNQNRTIFEIVIMASLLEKEALLSADRKIISGIFWKRIKDNYPLESDATLSYIFNDKKTRHSIEETKIDSPYNTYLHPGLPPTPINNPGLDAIEAAIYPQESNYYFFLTKPDTGEAVFASTLKEHNLNKKKYLK